MSTYYYGTRASASARQDLGPVVGPYLGTPIADTVGTPGWGASVAAGQMEVPGPGRLVYDGSAFLYRPTSSASGIRALGDPAPRAPKAKYNDYALNLDHRGESVDWDEADPQIAIRERQLGVSGVEAWQMARSANHCHELEDNALFGDSGVAGTSMGSTANAYWAGWDGSSVPAAADTAATGSQWSGATGTIPTHISAALIAYEAATGLSDQLDTLVCSNKTKLYMLANTVLRGIVSPLSTSGPMSMGMLLEALSGFGIRNLIVCPTGKPIADTVFLLRSGGDRDPLVTFCGAVFCWARMPSVPVDADGYMFSMWSDDGVPVHHAYASRFGGFVLPYEGGARITDVY